MLPPDVAARWMALSLTTHELVVTFSSFLCQPFRDLPSNRSTQPAASSSLVSVLSPCAEARLAAKATSANRAPILLLVSIRFPFRWVRALSGPVPTPHGKADDPAFRCAGRITSPRWVFAS